MSRSDRSAIALVLGVAVLGGAGACSSIHPGPTLEGDDQPCNDPATCDPDDGTVRPFGTPLFDDPAFLVEDPYAAPMRPTAVGGQQVYDLEWVETTGIEDQLAASPFVGAFTASLVPDGSVDGNEGGAALVGSASSTVTVRGVAPGQDTLSIDFGGSAASNTVIAAVAVDTIAILPITGERLAARVVPSFVAGDVTFGVGLIDSAPSDPIRAVDTAMTLTGLIGATRPTWDTLAMTNAAIGTHTLTVSAAGGSPRQFPIAIVTAPDTLAARDGQTTIDGDTAEAVCFDATAAGSPVVGLAWTLDAQAPAVEVTDPSPAPNCVLLAPMTSTQSIVIGVTAGPLAGTFAFAVTHDE